MKESRSSRDKKQKKKKTNKDDEKSSRKIQKKAKKKEKKRREKELKKQIKLLKNRDKKKQETVPETLKEETEIEEDCGPSIGKQNYIEIESIIFVSRNAFADLMNRAKCPETKEQWELRQSVIKRVVDPETGRTR